MRRAILDAARHLFIDGGYANVPIRRVASQLDYSPAALYRYFPTKDEIFNALAEEGFQLLMSRETLPAWPGQEPPPPAEERLGSRMLETLLEVMDVSQLDTSVRHAAQADVVVTPRFGPSTWRDFELADLFLAAGRQAAQEQLSALQSLARPQAAAVAT